MSSPYLLTILGIAVLLYLVVALRVLRQYERGVVFLLGKFAGVRGPGLTLIFVPIQQMVRVSLRTVTMQIPSQKIITKDNVSIDIAAVAYYHISDPEKAVIAIENVYNAINQISQTTVRNVVGRFSLDQLLSDRQHQRADQNITAAGAARPSGSGIKDTLLDNSAPCQEPGRAAAPPRSSPPKAAPGRDKLGQRPTSSRSIRWRCSCAPCRRWRKSRSRRTRPSSSPLNS
jgi:hypothetical protein